MILYQWYATPMRNGGAMVSCCKCFVMGRPRLVSVFCAAPGDLLDVLHTLRQRVDEPWPVHLSRRA